MIGMHRREPREVFDADGFYRTGDLCRIDEDGHLFFFARANDMVKVNGANVAPAEVERAIRAGGDIRDVCVMGMPGADRDETLVAAIVGDADLTADEMRARLKPLLAGYKIPRHFFFYRGGFQMTASQKIDKQLLRREIGKALAEQAEQISA
jgi:feruloyl-CoA synthase